MLPNGPGIELPAAREGTTSLRTAAGESSRVTHPAVPAAGCWEPWQAEPLAAGQLQCLVGRRARIQVPTVKKVCFNQRWTDNFHRARLLPSIRQW